MIIKNYEKRKKKKYETRNKKKNNEKIQLL